MYLTSEYQLIGQSTWLKAKSYNYYFFTETYARAIPDETEGTYTVYLKLLMACNKQHSFINHASTYSGSINGTQVFEGRNSPDDNWTINGERMEFVISEGVLEEVDCSDGSPHDISLYTFWRYLGDSLAYTPNYGAVAEISKIVTLPAIPRASKISNLQSSNGCLDGIITYTLTPASAALKNRHTVKYNGNTIFSSELGSFSGAQTISVDLSGYLESIYNAVKNTTDVNVSVILETYNDTAVIGTESDEKIIKIPVNEATRPVIESVILSPGYYNNVSFGGSYVKGKSLINKTVNARTKYGADISDYIVTIDGNVYSGSWLSLSGDRKISVTVKDSRGILSLPYEENIYIYEYRAPLIVNHSAETEILCYRCDDNGKQTDTGANAYIKLGKQFSDIPGNVCRVNYRLRGEGEPWGEYELLDHNGTEYVGIVSGLFPNPSKAYHIQLQIIDSGNESTTKTYPIAADWVDYQYNGDTKSWAFGESAPTSRDKAFSLGLRAFFDKGVEPIAFIENNKVYGGEEMTLEDENLLLPTSNMYNYTLFVVKALGEAEYALGIRIGNIINFIGYESYIRLGETSFTLVQGSNYQSGADFKIIAIYGLI